MDHKEQLTNFINGMIAQGVPAAKAQEIAQMLLADDKVTTYFSGGVLAKNLLDSKMHEVRTITEQLKSQQTQWNQYLERANQTLSTAEQEKTQALQQKAAVETAIKALAAQYNIPESDVAALVNTQQQQQQQQSYQQQQQQPMNLNPNPNPAQPKYLTADEINPTIEGLVNDILLKDSINARHFSLTGKPWDPMKAADYIRQQAQLGNKVSLEQAWRVTEGIDALEANAKAAADKAFRDQLEKEIREKIASESTTLPTDAQPNFGEARISSIFSANTETDAEGKQVQKEQTGHHGRTREAIAAFNRLATARRLGQPSPYETANQ